MEVGAATHFIYSLEQLLHQAAELQMWKDMVARVCLKKISAINVFKN